ncbi:Sec-independent protein translocase protein TatB [Rhodospirillales bacterium]|nr:Sec-independent protein translocase protein TatB [Rhodospirillales bacterium]
MFDIGWTEITVILVIAIIVIGPKDLPKVLRAVGQWVAKAKAMTRDFRGHVDEMIRETEIDEVKKQIDSIDKFDANSALENTIDAEGDIREAFDFDDSNTIDSNDQSQNEGSIDDNRELSKRIDEDTGRDAENFDDSLDKLKGSDT